MMFWDLNGKQHNVLLRTEDYPIKPEGAAKSKLQFLTGQKLQEFLPFALILEEFKIPGHDLYIDFFIPHKLIAIEIQGQQHNKFVPFFHKTIGGFVKSQDRDTIKKEWCRINNIDLIEIFTEKDLEELL